MANLSLGIVGLPNVGKSTLFNSLLKKQVALAANYPFATIEPNVGIVEVPDDRLSVLQKLVNAQKTVPAVVEFYDIAGLVRGASTGEGLGNKFLSHIREVAAIVHVTRLFEDSEIIHVANKVDPVEDIKTIETELIFADLATLEKQRRPGSGKLSKEQELFFLAVDKLKDALDRGIPARNVKLSEDERLAVRQLSLLTAKPVLFVFNVSESQLEHAEETKKQIAEILSMIGSPDATHLYLSAKLENDVLGFSEEEQKEYLQQYNLEETGLNRLIRTAYATLNLISYLTAGEKEVRAWTIKTGTLAPDAAGVIHTDFSKHFIKADVIPFPDFVSHGGWVKAREAGKVLSAGRDYVIKDGDVVEFKVGV
ncbi:MAG: redox-regulated ATPase YchF [Patescibacteria group bacterium]|nr:redox-regulated ATPase YchF [Patescibacteria group bacterium]